MLLKVVPKINIVFYIVFRDVASKTSNQAQDKIAVDSSNCKELRKIVG